MSRILISLILLILFFPGKAQVYHSCPIHPPEGEYENPLYDQWLSAYDVKHYQLTLEVSNTNTHIEGIAEVVLEVLRDLDTLVFMHHNDAIYIKLDRTRNQGDHFRVKIQYGGDAGQSRGFFAGISHKRGSDYGFDVTYTLSEPQNAKDWFPPSPLI